jgi:hypothetical protein
MSSALWIAYTLRWCSREQELELVWQRLGVLRQSPQGEVTRCSVTCMRV